MDNEERSNLNGEDNESTVYPRRGTEPVWEAAAGEDGEATFHPDRMTGSASEEAVEEDNESTVYPRRGTEPVWEEAAEEDDEATIYPDSMKRYGPGKSAAGDSEATVYPRRGEEPASEVSDDKYGGATVYPARGWEPARTYSPESAESARPAEEGPAREENTASFDHPKAPEPERPAYRAPEPERPAYRAPEPERRETAYTPPRPPQTPPAQPTEPKKTGGKKWLIPVIAAVAVIALLAVLIPVMRSQSKIKRYNQGADMIESGDYQGAYEVFKELGNYEDSFTMAMYAQRGIGYKNALALMENKEYTSAAETFDGLAGFKDSRDLAAQCRQELAYQRAVALFDAGDYTGAREAFEAMDGFRESKDYITRCGNELASIAYNKAIQEGDYRKALEVLDSGEGSWENEEAMRAECSNHLLYQEATEDLANGLNYTAYKKFLSLGSFLDSAERAKNCKVSKPGNGEVYRNSKYKTKYFTLKIKTPNDGNFNYLKIYAVNSSGKETLAVSVFIRANKTVSITLPKGTYAFKCAYGSGAWFGEKEMFGDDAVYQRLTPNGNNSYTFSKKGTYTLTLRNATNGNTGAASEPRGTF
jgi:tetratricopeptide (TPR) repeat protein